MDYITTILIVIGGIIILSDIIIPSGGMLSAAGAALIITAGWNYIGVTWVWQIVFFFPTWILAMFICYKVMATGGSFFEKMFLPDKITTNFQSILGKGGEIYSLEDNKKSIVRAVINGDSWICHCEEELKVGDKIIVVNIINDEIFIKKKEE